MSRAASSVRVRREQPVNHATANLHRTHEKACYLFDSRLSGADAMWVVGPE